MVKSQTVKKYSVAKPTYRTKAYETGGVGRGGERTPKKNGLLWESVPCLELTWRGIRTCPWDAENLLCCDKEALCLKKVKVTRGNLG